MLPTQLALCGDGGGHALKSLLLLAASPHAFPRKGALALLAPVARVALGAPAPAAAAAAGGVSLEKLLTCLEAVVKKASTEGGSDEPRRSLLRISRTHCY